MECPNCNLPVPHNANFCPNCGHVLNDRNGKISNLEENLYSGMNRKADAKEPDELKLRHVFAEVFKTHTEEQAEKMFIVGTRVTTPEITQITATWPKPWLFARVFLVVIVVYFGLYTGVSLFGNFNFLPGLIIVGAFMVPLTILVFFWEINAPQNIPIYRVVYIVFVGGIISLVTALFLYESLRNYSGVIITGFVEEAAKLVVVAWFLRSSRYNRILNGLLTGAAVGTGFAAFETAGYALRIVLETSDLQELYSTILWRGILAPGGHIVWAALCGAAVCMSKANRDWKWPLIGDIRLLRIFIIVVALHALWDLIQLQLYSVPIVQVILMLVSWGMAFSMIKKGLNEISRLKREAVSQRTAFDSRVLRRDERRSPEPGMPI